MKCHNCALRDAKPCMECSMCMSGDSHFRPIPNAIKKSNADRIRAMSDEELAKFISIQSDDCLCSDNSKCDYHCGGDSCLKVLLDWLQQPAEEDA